MSKRRRIEARLEDAVAVSTPEGHGVRLVFRSDSGETLDAQAELGPERSLASAQGVACLRRLLRVARRQAPETLLGDPEQCARRLREVRGLRVRLEVRERVRVRFTAWTDAELRVIDDVQDVREDAQGFVIRRLDGRPPVRLPRQGVSRGRTTRYTWLEITGIERP